MSLTLRFHSSGQCTEETEHVKMLQEEMAKLPPSASVEVEFDLDESPYL